MKNTNRTSGWFLCRNTAGWQVSFLSSPRRLSAAGKSGSLYAGMSVQGVVRLYFFISSPYGRQQERIFAALYGLFLITERRIVPMKQLFPRGKRIRPTDKDLVFHTALCRPVPLSSCWLSCCFISGRLPEPTGRKCPFPR